MTMTFRSAVPLALAVCVALPAGCRRSRTGEAPPPPPPSPAPITAQSADRVRLGMTAEAVLAAYGTRARRATVAREGMEDPVVQVTDPEGKLLLTADLQDGRVFRIHVQRPTLATEAGARVGTRVRTLEQLYGRGQALVGEGVVCVVFPRTAPGLSFCLADAYRLITAGRPPDWDRLREADPPVETILVVGSAVEAGSASEE